MNHHEEAIAAITKRRYILAAENMIFEFLGDSIIKYKANQILRLEQYVAHELQQQHTRMMQWKYSGHIKIKNRTELAEEVYERMLPALESLSGSEHIVPESNTE